MPPNLVNTWVELETRFYERFYRIRSRRSSVALPESQLADSASQGLPLQPKEELGGQGSTDLALPLHCASGQENRVTDSEDPEERVDGVIPMINEKGSDDVRKSKEAKAYVVEWAKGSEKPLARSWLAPG